MPPAELGTFELPNTPAALAAMRALQLKSGGGLSALMSEDTSAKRAGIQKALYDSAAEGINTAADRQRQAMVEGTFARGVGPSSITVELAGRGQQEHSDALARAALEAYTGAGAEQRADLASRSGLYNTGFAAATAGLQGDANIALTNLARQQQESQFGRNLDFQGSENAANRAQQESQFGRNLGLSYDQLGQQESQFGRSLSSQTSEAALNRELQKYLQATGQSWQGAENQANRALTQSESAAGRGWTSAENQANRALTQSESAAGRGWTSAENDANRALQQYLQATGQSWQGAENQANRALQQTQTQQQQGWQSAENQAGRALQQYLAQSGQDFSATQNQQQRDHQMAQLLLQLANSQDIAAGNQAGALGGAAAGGIGALLGPLLAMLFGED